MKTAKPIAIHLDRLDAALGAHGVKLKRHELLDIASRAFGHQNPNETSALAAAGDLDPPPAQPIARVDVGDDSVMLMRDMQTEMVFGVSERFLSGVATDRTRQFANTPYGGMTDLRRVSVSDAPTLAERMTVQGGEQWVAVIQHGDGFHGHTWFREASARHLATEIAAWCVEWWSDARDSDDSLPADTKGLSDLEVIEGYFKARNGIEHLLMDGHDGAECLVLLRDGILENDTAPATSAGVRDGRFRAYPTTAWPSGVPGEDDHASSHDTLEEAIAACKAGSDGERDSAVVDHVGRHFWRALRNWERQDMPALAQSDDPAVTTFHLDGRPMDGDELAGELERIADYVRRDFREGEVMGGWWWRILGEGADAAKKCIRCDNDVDPDGLCTDIACPFSEMLQDDERGFDDHPEGDPRR